MLQHIPIVAAHTLKHAMARLQGTSISVPHWTAPLVIMGKKASSMNNDLRQRSLPIF